jgi:AraC family transcriptional regulator, glycine betaine-responsive activator
MFRSSPDPLDIILLVLPESSLMSLAATLDPMRAANRMLGRASYRWKLVSIDGTDPATSCGLRIPVDGALNVGEKADVLIVFAAFNVVEHADRKSVRMVRRASRNSSFVGGVEAGPWVLALAGLLDGRRATTHWEDLEEFAARFPEVDARPDRWIVDGRVFTTGGAAPALDFMLSLIRARQGHTLSLDVASLYVYDGLRTGSEAQPSVSLGRLAWHEPRVTRAIRLMEAHLEEPLAVSAIARHAGVSTKTLESLFATTLGTPPGAFYLGLRLKAARRMIVDTRLSVTETAARTGFSSVATLSRAFKRQFGLTPTAARRASL